MVALSSYIYVPSRGTTNEKARGYINNKEINCKLHNYYLFPHVLYSYYNSTYNSFKA